MQAQPISPGRRHQAYQGRTGGSVGSLRRQGIFWILTSPWNDFTPYPMPGQTWSKGQLERGAGGFLHWQHFVAFHEKKSLAQGFIIK